VGVGTPVPLFATHVSVQVAFLFANRATVTKCFRVSWFEDLQDKASSETDLVQILENVNKIAGCAAATGMRFLLVLQPTDVPRRYGTMPLAKRHRRPNMWRRRHGKRRMRSMSIP
jgi:hypothetical protein